MALNFSGEHQRHRTARRRAEAFTARPGASSPLDAGLREPGGSNGIAIAPQRACITLLLINPHTSFFFLQAQVTSDGELSTPTARRGDSSSPTSTSAGCTRRRRRRRLLRGDDQGRTGLREQAAPGSLATSVITTTIPYRDQAGQRKQRRTCIPPSPHAPRTDRPGLKPVGHRRPDAEACGSAQPEPAHPEGADVLQPS